MYRPYDLKWEYEPNLLKKWKTKLNGNNFSKYSLIFAFSTILIGNKYIFTYLIRISIKMTQNKYTYKKKVSRRNPECTDGDIDCLTAVVLRTITFLHPPFSLQNITRTCKLSCHCTSSNADIQICAKKVNLLPTLIWIIWIFSVDVSFV